MTPLRWTACATIYIGSLSTYYSYRNTNSEGEELPTLEGSYGEERHISSPMLNQVTPLMALMQVKGELPPSSLPLGRVISPPLAYYSEEEFYGSFFPGDLGFINIYAPVEPLARKVMWETMSRELPSTCRWILLGDFNMVEKREDKTSKCGKAISSHERLLFNTLKDSLQIEELPLTNPSLAFSWDNACSDSSRVMACLDRCYIFCASPLSNRKLVEYRIRSNHTRSDHCPLSIVIELAKPFALARAARRCHPCILTMQLREFVKHGSPPLRIARSSPK